MRYQREKGHALIELALMMPILTMLLAGTIEVGNAINAYLTIEEASREAARLIVRKGSSANVNGLVQSLTNRLPTSTYTVVPTYGTDSRGGRNVTIQVNYNYRYILSNSSLVKEILPDPFTLQANTTMPIP
jgi:Flp pilus assembly protein TadG